MNFGGFQKLSLVNYPGRLACAVFTYGCNFRCPYCHNADLLTNEYSPVKQDEVINYMLKRRGKQDGICISGGEPLLSEEILPFLAEIKHLGFRVKLDTNGSFPERLECVLSKGLVDYVAMDVKNSIEKYAETTGSSYDPADRILESMDILKRGKIAYEFRTTIVEEYHCASDIKKIAEMLSDADIWYLQTFRDTPEVPQKGLHAPSAEKLKEYVSIGNQFIKTILRQ